MKKLIDEHGRLWGKISILDIFVIILAVLLLSGLYVKYGVMNTTSKAAGTTAIAYTVKISGIREFSASALKEGDLLYDKNNSGGYAVGTITGIEKTDAKKLSETADGKLVLGNYPGYYDVVLTITANGTRTEGRYLVNKTYELNANSVRTYNTKYCSFEGTLTEIK